jgi:hypothetical protein
MSADLGANVDYRVQGTFFPIRLVFPKQLIPSLCIVISAHGDGFESDFSSVLRSLFTPLIEMVPEVANIRTLP